MPNAVGHLWKFVSVAFLVGTLHTSATIAQSVALGAKAGLNVSSRGGEFVTPENPYSGRSGIVAGLAFSGFFDSVLRWQTELLYSQKGVRQPSSDIFEMRVHYLEAPILLIAVLPLELLGASPIVGVGVAPAVELSCGGTTRPHYIGPTLPPPIALDCDDHRTDRLDFGLVVDGGLEMGLGGLEMTIEARYTHGIADLAGDWQYVSSRNRTLSVLLGIARR